MLLPLYWQLYHSPEISFNLSFNSSTVSPSISGILYFNNLTENNIIDIIHSKGILSPNIVDKIVSECNYKKIGAKKIDYLVSMNKEMVEV